MVERTKQRFATSSGILNGGYASPGIKITPLSEPPLVTYPKVDEITSGTVDGTGIFDKLMVGVKSQLEEQFKLNRIKGADYADLYLASIQTVLQLAINFELTREKNDLENKLLAEKIVSEKFTQKLAQEAEIKAKLENRILQENWYIAEEEARNTPEKLYNERAITNLQSSIQGMENRILQEKRKVAEAEAGAIATKLSYENNILNEQASKVKAEADLLGKKSTTETNQQAVLARQKQAFTDDLLIKKLDLLVKQWGIHKTADPSFTSSLIDVGSAKTAFTGGITK